MITIKIKEDVGKGYVIAEDGKVYVGGSVIINDEEIQNLFCETDGNNYQIVHLHRDSENDSILSIDVIPFPKPDKPVSQIIYFYDFFIKSYTFLLMDDEGNTLKKFYCNKPFLQSFKDRFKSEYGIKPVKE